MSSRQKTHEQFSVSLGTTSACVFLVSILIIVKLFSNTQPTYLSQLYSFFVCRNSRARESKDVVKVALEYHPNDTLHFHHHFRLPAFWFEIIRREVVSTKHKKKSAKRFLDLKNVHAEVVLQFYNSQLISRFCFWAINF